MNRSLVPVEKTRQRVVSILTGVGLPEQDAVCVVDSLIDAEISGVESHGLMRLSAYVDRVVQGVAAAAPEINIVDNGAVATVDGGNGLGQVVMGRAVDICMKMAKQYGVGIVTVNHSNHFGTAALYSRKLADQGCIGFVASMAGPTMAPFGGMDLLLGTNPFSVAFPGRKLTFCADMASSAVAKGKIRIYAKNGQALPMGWALDESGNDTTDPHAAIKGILLPMGGHKGYALAMAVDALCGLLSGGSLSCESTSMFYGSTAANTGHFIAAVDIGHFLPLEEFVDRAQDWFDRIHTSKPRPGFKKILIPGEPEAMLRAKCGERIEILKETADMIDAYYRKYAK